MRLSELIFGRRGEKSREAMMERSGGGKVMVGK